MGLAGGPERLDHLPGFPNGNRRIQAALESPDGNLWLSTPVRSLDRRVGEGVTRGGEM